MVCQTTVGIQPFGSYTSGFDQINLADLGVHIDIPLFEHHSRGKAFGDSVHLVYNSGFFDRDSGSAWVRHLGWSLSAGTATGVRIGYDFTYGACGAPLYNSETRYSFYVISPTGFIHGFPGQSIKDSCNHSSTAATLQTYASDGSGYLLSTDGNTATVADFLGTVFTAAYTSGDHSWFQSQTVQGKKEQKYGLA